MTAKTWGPFTGRQLTTMFVALMVGAVMVPSAVWAVDEFTNVAIMDPVTGYKAKVFSGGNIRVSDNSGPMTVDGTVAVSSSRTAPLNVREARRPWQEAKYLNIDAGATSGCQVLSNPPAGNAVHLRSAFVATNVGAAFTRIYLTGHYDAGGFLPLMNLGFPALDSASTARMQDIDLIYVGPPLSTGRPGLLSLHACWARPSGQPAVALHVTVGGELYTP